MFSVSCETLSELPRMSLAVIARLRGGSDPGVVVEVVAVDVAVEGPAAGQRRRVGRVAQLGLRHGQHAHVDGKGHHGDDGDQRHDEEHEHRAAAAARGPLFCRGLAGHRSDGMLDLTGFEPLVVCMVSLPRFDARW